MCLSYVCLILVFHVIKSCVNSCGVWSGRVVLICRPDAHMPLPYSPLPLVPLTHSGHAINAALENERVCGAALFLGAIGCFNCFTGCFSRQREDGDEDEDEGEDEDDAGQDEHQLATIPTRSPRLAAVPAPTSIVSPVIENTVPALAIDSPTEDLPAPTPNKCFESTLPFSVAFRRLTNPLPTGRVLTDLSPSLSSSAATSITALDINSRQTSAVVARGTGSSLRMARLRSSPLGSLVTSGFPADAGASSAASSSTDTLNGVDGEEMHQEGDSNTTTTTTCSPLLSDDPNIATEDANINFLNKMKAIHLNSSIPDYYETSSSISSSAYSATLSISTARSISPFALPPPQAPAAFATAAVGLPPPVLGFGYAFCGPPTGIVNAFTARPGLPLPFTWNTNWDVSASMDAGRYIAMDSFTSSVSCPDDAFPPSILLAIEQGSLAPFTSQTHLDTHASHNSYKAAAFAAAAAQGHAHDTDENDNGDSKMCGLFIRSFMVTSADSRVHSPSPLMPFVRIARETSTEGKGHAQVGFCTGAGEISSSYDEAVAGAIGAAVAPAATPSRKAAVEAEENWNFYLGQKQYMHDLLTATPITALPACQRDSQLHPIEMGVLPPSLSSLAPGSAGQVFSDGTLLHLSDEHLWLATLQHMLDYENHKASCTDLKYQAVLGKGNFAVVVEVGPEEDYNGAFAAKVIHLTGELTTFTERYKVAAASVKEVMLLKECLGMEGVVQIKAVALYRGNFVIILDLAQGTLFDFLKGQERSSVSEFVCRQICMQLVMSVEVLNNRGIIHGDIKLENVLVREDKFELTDLNVAMKGEPGHGLVGQMGTWGYWAPEVDENRYHDFRADLFSVGRVILHLACGNTSLFYADADEISSQLKEYQWSQAGIDTLLSILAYNPDNRPLAWQIEVTWQ